MTDNEIEGSKVWNSNLIASYQVSVTYTTDAEWEGFTQTSYADRMAGFIKKLQSGEDVTCLFRIFVGRIFQHLVQIPRCPCIILLTIFYQPHVIIGIQAESPFWECLQIACKTFLCLSSFTSHIDSFGSYECQGIPLVHIKVHPIRDGRCIIGIFIHLVKVDVDGLQVTLGQSCFFTARIILDYFLISSNGFRILIVLIIQ